MTRPDIRDSHLQTIVPVLAVLMPVIGAVVVDPQVFQRIYEHRIMDLLSDVFCMFVALGLSAFMLLRYAGSRTGLHFWFGTSLLAQGILLGFHALSADPPLARNFQAMALLSGGLLASAAWSRPEPRCRWVGRFTPLLVVAVMTIGGLVLLRAQGTGDRIIGSFEGIVGSTALAWAAVVFNVMAAARFFRGYLHRRLPSLLWFAVFGLLTAVAAGLIAADGGAAENWQFHVIRVSAFTILMAYAATVTTREVQKLGRTEYELRRSEARFKAITENTSDIILVLDQSGVFTYVSPAAARVTGKSVEDMIGRPPGSYTHEEDVPKVRYGLREAVARPGRSVNIGSIRVRHSDGHWMSVEGVYTCLYEDSSVEGIVLNYRDVTDRVTSEQALEQSRQQLGRLIANLPGMVYRCKAEPGFPVEYMSEYCRELTGYTAMELMSGEKSAKDIVHQDDLLMMRNAMREAVKARQPFRVEYRTRTQGGEDRWVMDRGVGIYDDDGTLVAIEGIILDITSLVESRRELQRTKFSMENANDALIWVARDGSLFDVNETACRYLGYTREELLKLRLHDVASDIHDDNWDIAWECVKREGATLIDSIYLTKTGRQFPVEVSSIFLDYEGEEYHCCFVRDITERKEAERQIQKMNQDLEDRVIERTAALEEAQAQLVTSGKMAALGGLVAGVAHEINTPLGIGVTAASHLDEKVVECERLYREQAMRKSDFEGFLGLARETSSLILTNLRRAADLVQGFKQVSVDQSSERRRSFQLNDYLGEVIMSLRPEYGSLGHSVDLDCAEGVSMDSYPGSLAQVMTNLIMNSVKHGFENRKGGHIWINVDGDEDSVRILYKDDGLGMDSEQVRRLYDPFYTTKRGLGGSGLGMNITYNQVTQVLKGSIECQSAPGHGTVFLMEFPRVTPVDTGVETEEPVGV